MARFGLIGPSYSSQSLNADCQVTMNWYTEILEQVNGKSAMVLYPTPGESVFAALPGQPVRGQCEINGRAFAVSGTNFCEVFANGTFSVIAQTGNDLSNVYMVASPQQLVIVSAGNLYVYWLQTTTGGTNPQVAGTFKKIPNTNFTLPGGSIGIPQQVEYIDGFFILLMRNSQTIYLSTPFDASTWPALQFITVSVFSDNVQSIIANQRRLWVLGRKRSTVYYDSGSANIFDVDPSGTMETGTASTSASVRLDNAVFWLDQDERGSGVVRRGEGYTPTRVSNHAIEFAMQGYPTIADCVAYSYQDQGHAFAVFNFPTANKTWVYDVATNSWHERSFFNSQTGLLSMHKSQNHSFAFGKHLVGDPFSGNLYQLSINTPTDNGGPIRRIRRSPHISTENKWTFYNELILDVEAGLGPQPPLLDGAGNARGPQIILRWSKDYGHTWSNEYMLDAGQAGQFKQRLRKSRMGRARDMVFEISTTDPIPWRIIEGYIDADGPAPMKAKQRLASTYGQVT
jgi:hypothetical protein